MRKATLEGNILPKAKQRFLVDGMVGADIQYLTRDVLEMTVGVIELPDQTKVPGGRRRAGEFTLTLQFAGDEDRNAYLEWFEQCIDKGGTVGNNTETANSIQGIHPDYKRNATIIFLRLYQGKPSFVQHSNQEQKPVTARVFGCWPSSVKVPDYDMNGDEGDGDCTMEITINYDDVTIAWPGSAPGMTEDINARSAQYFSA
jgi:hypothetical protein